MMNTRNRVSTRGKAGHWVAAAATSSFMNPSAPEDQQYYEQALTEDAVEMEAQDQIPESEPKKKRPWEKIDAEGKVIKKKPNPQRKNAIFRKALQPKTAIMCLNELQTGLKYEVETMTPIGNFRASVTVNGQIFKGYGSSKTMAKQAAAEAALASFVRPPPPKPAPGQSAAEVEDDTPWKTIASFAMYKLFSEWSDGKMSGAPAGIGPAMGMNEKNFHPYQAMTSDLRSYLANAQMHQSMSLEDVHNPNVSLHLHKSAQASTGPLAAGIGPNKMETDSVPKPPKEINTENQQSQHPVMVLHQLVPNIKYDSQEEIVPGTNQRKFTFRTFIQDHEIMGEGPSMKKAKFQLAKVALKTVFDVDNTYELPN